ncbi:DUF427 domain-containing protein [soil metagenome]
MVRAVWNGVTIAESDDTVIVENNHYFPIESITPGVLTDSSTTSVCPWKGTANYYTVRAGGAENPDAAWYYKCAKREASEISGRVAFWKGVTVG